MKPYRLIYSPVIAQYIRHLAPSVKMPLRSAIESLATMPTLGKNLTGEFAGLRSLRYKRYRVIYRYKAPQQSVEIVFAGARTDVYKLLAEYLKKQSEQ